jgi:RNA polymerase sigma-70 factor (ECF subfamily)
MKTLQEIANDYIECPTEENFKKLYTRIDIGLKVYIWSFIKHKADRKELLLELIARTYYKIIKNISQYNPIYNFSTWAYTIAKHESLLEIKRGNRYVSLDSIIDPMNLDDESNCTDTEFVGINNEFIDNNDILEYSEEQQERIHLYNATVREIDQLPEQYRDILIEREFNDLPYEDIANKYDMNLNTVRSRIHLARLLVQSNVKKNYISIFN